MKRSGLKRKTELARAEIARLSASVPSATPLPRSPRGKRPSGAARAADALRTRQKEPGRAVWKTPHRGKCAVCGKPGLMVRHHVITEQRVRRAVDDVALVWDMRNALALGASFVCDCHERHHGASRRIPLAKVPPDAIDFARQILGREAADAYLARHYG